MSAGDTENKEKKPVTYIILLGGISSKRRASE